MPRTLRDRRSGSILVMVTLAMFVMFGMLGLAVDLGWAHFTKKSAQTAADAAALAAVKMAKDNASELTDYNCSGGFVAPCAPTPVDCPSVPTALQGACLYASMHGFTTGDRQRVTVQSWDRSGDPTVAEACGQEGATVFHPPTAGCVDVYYWVTVRIAENIPQLFSAILGNTEGTVSARATAAVAQSKFIGSLILLNRQNEEWIEDTGTNLFVSGSPTVIAPGGILLSSHAHGPGVNQDPWAGYISGSGIVNGPSYFRDDGWYAISGSGQWLGGASHQSNQDLFADPMSGKGQPPIGSPATNIPVPGGTLNAALCGGDCPSANYYATGVDPMCSNCPLAATGEPVVINSNVTFNGGPFGEFHFFGGLKIGQATVTFGPGRYVLAGVKSPDRTPLFDNENKAMLLSNGRDDAGRVFILTDTQYEGLPGQINNIPERKYWGGADQKTLFFSKSAVKAGNNVDSRVELYGLNRLNHNLPPELKKFAPAVIWQDQRNSYVAYDEDGYIVACDGLDNPCPGGATPPSTSPQLEIWATPFAHIEGMVYQPRGAWAVIQASGDYEGPLRIITGSLKTQGTGRLTLTGDAPPIVTYVTALVE